MCWWPSTPITYPLHRQEAIYARAGVPIPRSTLAQWVGSCGVQLQPLASALRAEVLAHAVLHADETPVQMLKPAAQRWQDPAGLPVGLHTRAARADQGGGL